MNFTSCFNRRFWDGVLALTNEGFRESMFGVTQDDALRARLQMLDDRDLLPQLQIQSIEENGTTGSELATLVVTWRAWNGVHQELWRLQLENGHWVLAGRSIRTPPVNGVAVGIRFLLEEGAIVSPATELANPGTIVFSFANELDHPARVFVLAIETETTVGNVVSACNALGAIGFDPVGSLLVPEGEIVGMPMFDLADGNYAIVAGADPCTGVEPIGSEDVTLVSIVAA